MPDIKNIDVLKLEIETDRVTVNKIASPTPSGAVSGLFPNPSMTANTTGWNAGPGVTVTASITGGQWVGSGLAAGALIGFSGNLTAAAGQMVRFSTNYMRNSSASGRIRFVFEAYNGAAKLGDIADYSPALSTVGAFTSVAFNTSATPAGTTHVVLRMYAVAGGAFDYLTSGFGGTRYNTSHGGWTASGAGVDYSNGGMGLYAYQADAVASYANQAVTPGQWAGFAADLSGFITPDTPVSLQLVFLASNGTTPVGDTTESTVSSTPRRFAVAAQVPTGAAFVSARVHMHEIDAASDTSSTVNYALMDDFVLTVEAERSYAEMTDKAQTLPHTNLIANGSGAKGAWGWASPVAGSVMRGSSGGILGPGPFIHYQPPLASVPNFFYTDPAPVTPGQYIAASWDVRFVGAFYRAKVEYLNSSKVFLSAATQTGYLEESTTRVQYGAFLIPAGAAYARLRFDLFIDTAGGNVNDPAYDIYLYQVMMATAATSASLDNLLYAEGLKWVNILAPAHEIKVGRKALDVGTLSATILDPTLDPATSDDVRPGKQVRLRVYDPVLETWASAYEGKLSNAQTAYDKGARGTRITIAATDNITLLANASESTGVATIAELPFILEGRGVPWNVNGSGQQVASATAVSSNDNASVLDQISVTRDSVLGYAWVDKFNVLKAFDSGQMPPGVVATFSDTTGVSYTDIDVDFNTDRTINEVRVKWLRYDSVTGDTTEIVYGPYVNDASIAQWGRRSAEFTIHGATENSASIAAFANNILTRNGTPSVRANGLTFPVKSDAGLAYAQSLDLYDLVTVAYGPVSLSTDLRVTSIEHTIAPTGWHVTLGFDVDNSVASPQATPAPGTPASTSVLVGVAGGGTGLSTVPAGNFLSGNGASPLNVRTPAQVYSDIGANNAANLSAGTVTVPRGGTGLATVPSGSFLTGAGTSALNVRTPALARTDIGADNASNLTTGTVADARLPTTMANKTLSNPTLTGTTTLAGEQIAAMRFGAASGTTNASGQLTVTHGLGVTPVAVLLGNAGFLVRTQSTTSTSFTVECRLPTTSAVAASVAVTFSWMAIA